MVRDLHCFQMYPPAYGLTISKIVKHEIINLWGYKDNKDIKYSCYLSISPLRHSTDEIINPDIEEFALFSGASSSLRVKNSHEVLQP